MPPHDLLICQIDAQDHYSYFDESISAYNVLRHWDAEGRKHSPALQSQNRVRHSEHLMFAESGWDVVQEGAHPVSNEHLAALRALPLHRRFWDFDLHDLAVRRSVVIARPAP